MGEIAHLGPCPEVVCPACREPLRGDARGLGCRGCGRTFPRVAGLPDLRLRSDRYLALDAERAKAERLARRAWRTDLTGLAETYYAITDDVDARRRARYLAHIARAEVRGAGLVPLLPRTGRILEIGCGSGGLLAAAAKAGRDITGIDIAARWLVVASRRLADLGLSVPLAAADAENLPWNDAQFDAVVADSLIEHLDDPLSALREAWRVLRPGGRLIVWGPNRHSLTTDPHVGLWGVGWLPDHWASVYVRRRRGCDWTVRPLSPGQSRRLAVEAGWSDVRVHAPEVPLGWRTRWTGRIGIRLYETLRRSCLNGVLRELGPIWQVVATRQERA